MADLKTVATIEVSKLLSFYATTVFRPTFYSRIEERGSWQCEQRQ